MTLQSVTYTISLCADAYDTRSVILRWKDENPIELPEAILNLPQFRLVNYYHESYEEKFKTGNIVSALYAFMD